MKEFIWSKKKIIIVCLIFVVLISFLIFRFVYNSSNDSEIEIVSSSSKFYTVSNCVSRYLNYWYVEDIDNLIILLDKSYVKNNNVNKKNFFDIIGKLDNNYSFEAHKMYQEILNKNVTKYYVQGYLVKEQMDGIDFMGRKNFYIVVSLDEKNSTYSITPYDGEIFVNGGL